MSPDTLEQRIRETLLADCDHPLSRATSPCWMCKQWAKKKAPDIARALEAVIENCRNRSDFIDATDFSIATVDAFIAALSEDK